MKGTLSLSYLLGVELLHHRLKSLLSFMTAPAKTTLTVCERVVKENEKLHIHEHKHIHTDSERKDILSAYQAVDIPS